MKKVLHVIGFLAIILVGVDAKAWPSYFCYHPTTNQYVAYIDEYNNVFNPNLDRVAIKRNRFLVSTQGTYSAIFVNKKIYNLQGKKVAYCLKGEL